MVRIFFFFIIKSLIILLMFIFSKNLAGQIPLFGTKTHFSITPPKGIITTKSQLWVYSNNMLASLLPNGSTIKWSINEHLLGDGILSVIPLTPSVNDDIIVWCKGGFINLISENKVKESNTYLLPDNFQINHYIKHEGKLLFASNVGILIFSASTLNRENTIKFGDTENNSSEVYSFWMRENKLWIHNKNGIYYLKDNNSNWYNPISWQKINTEELKTFNNLIYSTYNNKKLYLADEISLYQVNFNGVTPSFVEMKSFSLESGERIKKIKSHENTLYIYTNNYAYSFIDNSFKKLLSLLTDWTLFNGKIYGVVQDKGLVTLNDELTMQQEVISFGTISANNIADITFGGGVGCAVSAFGYHIFKNRKWRNFNANLYPKIVYHQGNHHFLAIDKDKNLISIDAESGNIYDRKSLNNLTGDVKYLSKEINAKNLFILTNHNSQYLFHLDLNNSNLNVIALSAEIKSLGEVKSITPNSPYIILSFESNVGLAIYNTQNQTWRRLTNLEDSGALPSLTINSVVIDNKKDLWVGTSEGVAYLYYRNFWTDISVPINMIKPIVGNARLLSNDEVIDIVIDSNNNKWIGIKNTIFYVNSNGTQVYRQFTKENGLGLIDDIKFMKYEEDYGELFVMSTNGLVSIKLNVQKSKGNYNNVRIFPNPLNSSVTQEITIDGLKANTTLKITDTKNQVIYEALSDNSGSIIWNLDNKYQERIKEGLYIFYFTDEESNHIEKVLIYSE